MYKNYIKIALRNIQKYKGYSFINILGLAIAWPVAFLAMRGWLNNFAYRITIGWMEFVVAGVLTFLIALLTVSYQSIKAGLANPADSIRYE